MEKIEPMSNVVCIWRGDHGGYPDGVKIAFMDGSIQRFWHEIQQPAPQVGYVGKHIKRAGGAGTPTDHKRNKTHANCST